MAYFTYISLAIFCVIAVCGGIPRPDTVRETNNFNTISNGSLKISKWLHSAIASGTRNTHKDAGTGFDYFKEQNDSSSKAVEDAVNDEVAEFGGKLIPSTFSATDKVNPFVRSKRSICATPTNLNLPQMVSDLKERLNATQFVGLNPEDSTPQTASTNQEYTCPSSTTGSWWPKSDDNLKSTCPWTITQIDLGVNAYPRYVNNATCMCSGCLGSPSMRCKEVSYDMTYFMRTGCENGLALMDTLKVTVNVGCHCVSASPNGLFVADRNVQ